MTLKQANIAVKGGLALSVVLLCVTQATAKGGCGSARDTDLDGNYVSSTSTDQCFGATSPVIEAGYRLRGMIGDQDKLTRLVELCAATVLQNPATDATKKTALTLFSFATKQGAESRAAGQKNAASCLSYVDPVAAMDFLSKVNFEQPMPGQWLYEDPRYNAAETIFGNFAKLKPLDVSSIAAEARYLGQTGQYPYVAIGKVVQQLPASLNVEANAFLSDALNFYAKETGFYNRDEEFLRMLQSLKDSSVDKNLIAKAVAAFVWQLQNDPVHIPGDYYAEVQINSSGKTFSFTDRNEAFLFQAFPVIRRFNARLAGQLRQQDARLEQATDQMTYISGGFVQGSQTIEHASRQHLEWLQASLVDRIQKIKECSTCNQKAAAFLTRRLTELNSQAVEFSAAIPGEARSAYVKQILTAP